MAVLDCRGNVYINQVFLCFDIDESGGPGDLVRAGRQMVASSRGAALLKRCTSRSLRSAFVPARALPTDTHTHAQTPPPSWVDQCEWHIMTRITGPDCAVMCNSINTHTHILLSMIDPPLGGPMRVAHSD